MTLPWLRSRKCAGACTVIYILESQQATAARVNERFWSITRVPFIYGSIMPTVRVNVDGGPLRSGQIGISSKPDRVSLLVINKTFVPAMYMLLGMPRNVILLLLLLLQLSSQVHRVLLLLVLPGVAGMVLASIEGIMNKLRVFPGRYVVRGERMSKVDLVAYPVWYSMRPLCNASLS